MQNKDQSVLSNFFWIIIIVLISIVLYNNSFSYSFKKNENSNIINTVLEEIRKNYVDSVDIDSLIERSIRQILTNLDPHSIYMNSDEVSSSFEMMQGSFEGIGIEFSIHQDTIIIVNVIPNGPSEKKGVQAGGRIIMIEGEKVAGIGIQNQDVIKKLRGKKGTIVRIGIQNRTDTIIKYIDIKRGKIPLVSLDVAYEIAPKIGYIKLNRFSATTFKEFKKELLKLKDQHSINSLILDLRGNSGGYLDQAIDILNEFFDTNKLLVYTKGNSRSETKYFSNHFGVFKNGNIHVLIDEGSASASEIVAGAIQDHGRGLILGTRSFGKGLVQEQIPLEDGSLIRLTVSRYHTPSGRCIQKPYEESQSEYFSETYLRSPEHIPANDSLNQFETFDGRIVYGGGGITPDHIIKADNDSLPTEIVRLYISDFFNDLAFNYVDAKRNNLSAINAIDFKIPETDQTEILEKSKQWVHLELGHIKHSNQVNSIIDEHKSKIITRLSALIIRQYWGWSEMQIFLNQNDEIIATSLSLLKD